MPPGSAAGAVGLANSPRGERPASSEKVVAPDSSLFLKFGSLQFLILGSVFRCQSPCLHFWWLLRCLALIQPQFISAASMMSGHSRCSVNTGWVTVTPRGRDMWGKGPCLRTGSWASSFLLLECTAREARLQRHNPLESFAVVLVTTCLEQGPQTTPDCFNTNLAGCLYPSKTNLSRPLSYLEALQWLPAPLVQSMLWASGAHGVLWDLALHTPIKF